VSTLRRVAVPVLALSCGAAAAQEEERPAPRRSFFAPAPRSPEVDGEGRITFRVRAPEAEAVLVARDGAEPAPMQKGADGVWSLTTEPLPPDVYPYRFVVDGLMIADPSNPEIKHILPGGNQSLAHVPGPTSLSWEVGDVPRGVVHHHFYRSGVVGEDRDYYVYTPPGYAHDAEQPYPVLFLLHGVTDDASAWTTAGRAHVILDNLIARGEAVPMVMVNTLGYGSPAARDGFAGMIEPNGQKAFGVSLVEEVLPRVEADYRVAADRERRAIAGLSMGGTQALRIGLNHLDRFAWVASFSGAFSMFSGGGLNDAVLAGEFPGLEADAVNPKLRLLWIACGVDDFLIQPNRQLRDWLEARGVEHHYHESEGAHTWMVWRRYLTELAPQLFRAAAD